MIIYNLKSDLQMTPDLILSLNLPKWDLKWLEVKEIVKINNPKTPLQPYIVLAMEMELSVYIVAF